MNLKDLRKNCNLTQQEAANVVGVSLRTYVSYENDEMSADQLKLERIKQLGKLQNIDDQKIKFNIDDFIDAVARFRDYGKFGLDADVAPDNFGIGSLIRIFSTH